MSKTYGLTHLSLAVQDPERSLRFYQRVLGLEECARDERSISVRTPGSREIIAFEKAPAAAGQRGGVRHFGFRLVRPEDLDPILQEVEPAGGLVLKRGAFAPGKPFAYFTDPDGYKIELWYG